MIREECRVSKTTPFLPASGSTQPPEPWLRARVPAAPGGRIIYRSRLPGSEGLEPLASRTFFEENFSQNFLRKKSKILQCVWRGASDCASPQLRCVRVCAVVGDCVPQPPRRWELGNMCETSPAPGLDVSCEGCRVRTELERFTRFATLRHAAASTRRGVVSLTSLHFPTVA